MSVNIIIPTHKRQASLEKTIHSIKKSDYQDTLVFIVADGFRDGIEQIKGGRVSIIYNTERRDWIYSMNKALKLVGGDYFLYGADDILFRPDCISLAVKAMQKRFPDGDGLVSLKQSQKRRGGAFGLIGEKFVKRFPGRAVFCPDYTHFCSDREIERFARGAGIYYLCNEAIVDHDRGLRDETYHLGRKVWEADMEIMQRRKDQGLLWGMNFGRVR